MKIIKTGYNEGDLIYQKLSDEQTAELLRFSEASNSTAARKEMLTYIQGMKDRLALLKNLSKN